MSNSIDIMNHPDRCIYHVEIDKDTIEVKRCDGEYHEIVENYFHEEWTIVSDTNTLLSVYRYIICNMQDYMQYALL